MAEARLEVDRWVALEAEVEAQSAAQSQSRARAETKLQARLEAAQREILTLEREAAERAGAVKGLRCDLLVADKEAQEALGRAAGLHARCESVASAAAPMVQHYERLLLEDDEQVASSRAAAAFAQVEQVEGLRHEVGACVDELGAQALEISALNSELAASTQLCLELARCAQGWKKTYSAVGVDIDGIQRLDNSVLGADQLVLALCEAIMPASG